MDKIFNSTTALIVLASVVATMLIFVTVITVTSTACEPYVTGRLITHKTGIVGVIETCDVIGDFVGG